MLGYYTPTGTPGNNSGRYPVPADATFIQFPNYLQEINDGFNRAIYAYFYDAAGVQMTDNNTRDRGYGGESGVAINSGNIATFLVPEGAASVYFHFGDQQRLLEKGVEIVYYTTPRGENLMEKAKEYRRHQYIDSGTLNWVDSTNASYNMAHMIPVQPGETYLRTRGASNTVYLWNGDRGYVGYMNVGQNRLFTIPDDVYYISIYYNDNPAYSKDVNGKDPGTEGYTGKYNMKTGLDPNRNGLYLFSRADTSSGYRASVSVTVQDTEGYMKKMADLTGGTPHATLTVEEADSMSQPEYHGTNFSQNVELVEGEDGVWVLKEGDTVKLLEKLTPNHSWRITLSAEYQGKYVVMDTITFRTDGAYTLIHNQRELLQINQNPYGNYLVVEDFEQYINSSVGSVRGTLDFQGHVVTRSAEAVITTSLITDVYGTVKNLVFDYPQTQEYVNGYAPITNVRNTGLVENYVVRTYGTVVVTRHDRCLGVYDNQGMVRNFILKLGGDVHMAATQSNDYMGVFMYRNIGTVENGYAYATGAYGALFYHGRGCTSSLQYGVITGLAYPRSVIRNVYTILNTWYEDSADNYSGVLTGYPSGMFSNIYHVGDFYDYSGSGNKNYAKFMPTTRVGRMPSGGSGVEEVYYVSGTAYGGTQSNGHFIKNTLPARLHDAEWQAQVLGSAFDAAGCVPMGFYPRLELPVNMQKYQDYIPLPITAGQSGTPKLVGDEWAGTPDNANGTVRFLFQNDRMANIISLTIPGLKVETPAVSQRALDNGLYEAVFRIEVPEDGDYLSTYKVTQLVYNMGGANITLNLEGADRYTTQNIEFWKEISTPEEWSRINLDVKNLELPNGSTATDMHWNYRIVKDLDFSPAAGCRLTPAAIILNGSTTDFTTGRVFRGKIDGQGHTIKNISLENMTTPWLICNACRWG